MIDPLLILTFLKSSLNIKGIKNPLNNMLLKQKMAENSPWLLKKAFHYSSGLEFNSLANSAI
jgi:hypothetical protein